MNKEQAMKDPATMNRPIDWKPGYGHFHPLVGLPSSSYTVPVAVEGYTTTISLPVRNEVVTLWGVVKSRDARIAELEAEVRKLSEAGKVLARGVVGDAKVYAKVYAKGDGDEERFRVWIDDRVWNNPTAAAWVREVSK